VHTKASGQSIVASKYQPLEVLPTPGLASFKGWQMLGGSFDVGPQSCEWLTRKKTWPKNLSTKEDVTGSVGLGTGYIRSCTDRALLMSTDISTRRGGETGTHRVAKTAPVFSFSRSQGEDLSG